MAVKGLQLTVAVATVLRLFLDMPGQERYGYKLMQVTGYPSGKLYPILARLERAGWLERHWESIDPSVEGRPLRRWYRLTDEGIEAARREIAALREQLTPASTPHRWPVLHPQGCLP